MCLIVTHLVALIYKGRFFFLKGYNLISYLCFEMDKLFFILKLGKSYGKYEIILKKF